MASVVLADWRNRYLSSARFREWAQKVPIIQLFASSQANELFRLAGGFIHSQVLLTCVRLDLFERLRHGPVPAEELTRDVGLSATGAEHLYTAAAALELVELKPGNRLALGRQGATLVDNPGVLAMVRHHALLYEDLVDPVGLFRGQGGSTRMARLWAYAGESDTGEASELDHAAVREYSDLMAVSQAMVAEQILGAVSFRSYTSLMDIGGGAGAFAMAAARRWPRLDVAIADLPQVADLARQRVRAAGLDRRIDVFGADATRDRLPDGYDAVSLVRILHDHDDDKALSILDTARTCLKKGGTLLVAEPMAGSGRAGRLVDAYFSVYLLAMGSGKPRTPKQLAGLLGEAGFRRVRRRRTSVPMISGVLLATR